MYCRDYKDIEVVYTCMFVHLFVLMVLCAKNLANKYQNQDSHGSNLQVKLGIYQEKKNLIKWLKI